MVGTKKHDYLDAVRGWAILLVITSHCGGSFAELPFPVRKLTNLGWLGVQMFFLASAVTLLMSWNRASAAGAVSSGAFFARRFFRIAPMYYCGAALYFVAEPPSSGFDAAQLLRSMLFLNDWSPDWIPTTPGWTVVPGGWSVGAEFTFYALFPLIAMLVTSMSRACVFFALTMIGAMACNEAATGWMTAYPDTAARGFLYFWFPNQMPIFALGAVLYFGIVRPRRPAITKRQAYGAFALGVTMLAIVAEHPSHTEYFTWSNPAPTLILVPMIFAVLIFVLSRAPRTLVTHPIIRMIGRLSFSAYVLHFLFVHGLVRWTDALIDAHAEGYAAIANLMLLWALVLICTLLSSWVTNRLIERPGMDLARRLTAGGGASR